MTSAAISTAYAKTPSPFSAILWKEFRQFWPIVLLALLAVCGFLVEILQLIPYYRGQVHAVPSFPLSHNYTLVLTTLVFPLIAVSLGFTQFFFETKPDLWAFLVHRPVHRSVIFRGKMAAGLLMYLAATIVPFTLAVLWQSSPEHIPAPFDWSLTAPGYIDLLNGAVYYFAAIVVARRQARWFGSRIFPIAFPIWNAMMVVATASLVLALITTTCFLALTFIAARGSFIAGGFYSPQNSAARFSLGAMVVSGLFFVGGIVILIASIFLSSDRDFEYQNYTVDSDGKIVLSHYRYSQGRYSESATDLEGREIPHPTAWKGVTYSLHDVSWGIGITHYRFPERKYFRLSNLDTRDYYFDHKRQCILVYTSAPRKFLGSIGPAGFAPDTYEPGGSFGQLVAPYYSDQKPLTHFIAGSAVYGFRASGDLAVETLYTALPGEKLLGTFTLYSKTGRHDNYVAVASSARVVILKPDNSILVDIPIAQIPQAMLHLWRANESDRFIVWYDQRHLPSDQARDYEFVTADAGEITRLKLSNPGGRTIYHVSEPPLALATALPPSLLALAYCFEMLDAFLSGRPWFPPLQRFDSETAWGIGFVSLGVVLSLVATVWISRRYAFSKSQTIAWCALAIALGISGVFLIVLLLDLPARLPCPSCKKRRIISRDLCEHCNAPFPAPAANGTEIFQIAPAPAEPLHA